MSELKVLAVMLARGRQAMVDRAVRSWQAQTYPNKLLAVLDSGSAAERLKIPMGKGIQVAVIAPQEPMTIGELRNVGAALSVRGALDCELIAHWDSDDWSGPERLTEQVALIQETGSQVVGYRQMLFWDSRPGPHYGAWLYTSQSDVGAIGTSLMYTRKTWSKSPFQPRQIGEDTFWLLHQRSITTRSALDDPPRMIAAIHGDNTAARIIPGAREWKRVPEWDRHCQEVMSL